MVGRMPRLDRESMGAEGRGERGEQSEDVLSPPLPMRVVAADLALCANGRQMEKRAPLLEIAPQELP